MLSDVNRASCSAVKFWVADDAAVALALGVFQVGCGLILYTAGSKTVPAAELTILSLSEVLLGPIWVWLFLGETATQLTLIGGAILLIAIIYNATMHIRKRSNQIDST